jgi:hypothetical protein
MKKERRSRVKRSEFNEVLYLMRDVLFESPGEELSKNNERFKIRTLKLIDFMLECDGIPWEYVYLAQQAREYIGSIFFGHAIYHGNKVSHHMGEVKKKLYDAMNPMQEVINNRVTLVGDGNIDSDYKEYYLNFVRENGEAE